MDYARILKDVSDLAIEVSNLKKRVAELERGKEDYAAKDPVDPSEPDHASEA